MKQTRTIKTLKKKRSIERENFLFSRGPEPELGFTTAVQLRDRENEQRRRQRDARDKIEGGSEKRRKMLDYIFDRDNGICYNCGLPVRREEATREHLFRPLRDYAHLGKDPLYMALAHKECNR